MHEVVALWEFVVRIDGLLLPHQVVEDPGSRDEGLPEGVLIEEEQHVRDREAVRVADDPADEGRAHAHKGCYRAHLEGAIRGRIAPPVQTRHRGTRLDRLGDGGQMRHGDKPSGAD